MILLQGSGDTDPLGNPFGFFNTPLAQHTPSYPLLVTTQMSRDRSVNQLILMSEGHYLSSTTSSMTLRLVSYNADAGSLAYIQFPFQWQDAGVIVGGPPLILALPILAYSSYASTRFAAFICAFVNQTCVSPQRSQVHILLTKFRIYTYCSSCCLVASPCSCTDFTTIQGCCMACGPAVSINVLSGTSLASSKYQKACCCSCTPRYCFGVSAQLGCLHDCSPCKCHCYRTTHHCHRTTGHYYRTTDY